MPVVPLDRLTHLLAAKLEEKPELTVLIYAPFGIVRGTLVSSNNPIESASTSDQPVLMLPMLLVSNVTVEHYSNHIPTASYDQLSINLNDIQGCALLSDR
jgi:hypothetical protein